MEQKNRLAFTAAVILLIFFALLVGFGRSIFQLDTPQVALPTVGQTPGDGPTDSAEDPSTVSVTPQTVQNVVATLERTDSYYREVTVEQFWVGGGSAHTVQTWVDQGWSRSIQVLPNGSTRHDLVGPEEAYFWYSGSNRYEVVPAGDNAADLAQRVPTYETVLDLDPAIITAAGYERREELPCIFLETVREDTATTTRYWISVDSGLLVCAERRRGEEVVYRMTAPDLQSPCPATANFALPNGESLHTA